MTTKQFRPFLCAAALALTGAWFLMAADGEDADKPKPYRPGKIVTQLVGRFLLSADGSSEVIGYFPFMDGVGGSLFSAEKTERRSILSFRSGRVSFTRLVNGSFFHFLLGTPSGDPVLYNIYFNPSPNRDFSNAATFADGQKVAVMRGSNGMFNAGPTFSDYSVHLDLLESADFVYQGRTVNAKDLGDALTVRVSGGVVPFADASAGLVSVPISGDAVALGK